MRAEFSAEIRFIEKNGRPSKNWRELILVKCDYFETYFEEDDAVISNVNDPERLFCSDDCACQDHESKSPGH